MAERQHLVAAYEHPDALVACVAAFVAESLENGVSPALVAVTRDRLRSARTRPWLPSSSSSSLRPPSPLIRVSFPPMVFDS
jgi:hypothetical protein